MRTAVAAAVLAAVGCSSGGGDGDSDPPRVLDGKVMLRLQSTEEFLSHISVRYHTAQGIDCDGIPPDSVGCGWIDLISEPIPAGGSVIVPDFPEGRWNFEMTTRSGTCTKYGVRIVEEETDAETEEYVLELCG